MCVGGKVGTGTGNPCRLPCSYCRLQVPLNTKVAGFQCKQPKNVLKFVTNSVLSVLVPCSAPVLLQFCTPASFLDVGMRVFAIVRAAQEM